MATKSPDWRGHTVFFLKVFAPEHRPTNGMQTGEVALGAEGVNFSSGNRGRATRTSGIGDCIGAFILVLPEKFSTRSIEAEHTLAAHRFSAIIRAVHEIAFPSVVVGEIDAIVGNGRTGIATLHAHPPLHRQACWRDRRHNARFPPHPIAIGPHPLRPIVGLGWYVEEKQHAAAQPEETVKQRSAAIDRGTIRKWQGDRSGQVRDESEQIIRATRSLAEPRWRCY